MAGAAQPGDRGRSAQRPADIPAQGWKDILLRVKAEMDAEHMPLIAAGVAFYGFLAVFPGIAALISLWALLAEPATLTSQLETLLAALPREAAAILLDQARSLAGDADAGTGVAALIGFAAALWSASRGVKSLMEGVNIAYDETDERGFVKANLIALGLTIALVAALILAVAVIAGVPILLDRLALDGPAGAALALLPWPALFLGGAAALALIYRLAPDRTPPRWRWLTWGAAAGMAIWVLGSIGFSLFVANFGDYNATYGALGGVIVLLLWLWLSALCVLIGAEINAQMERQTADDTTEGEPAAMGRRGAHAADTLGEAKS